MKSKPWQIWPFAIFLAACRRIVPPTGDARLEVKLLRSPTVATFILTPISRSKAIASSPLSIDQVLSGLEHDLKSGYRISSAEYAGGPTGIYGSRVFESDRLIIQVFGTRKRITDPFIAIEAKPSK